MYQVLNLYSNSRLSHKYFYLCIINSVCGSPLRSVLHSKKVELGFSIIAKSRFFYIAQGIRVRLPEKVTLISYIFLEPEISLVYSITGKGRSFVPIK